MTTDRPDGRPEGFVEKLNADGSRRFYWQPSAARRREGWQTLRLPDGLHDALAAARAQNAKVEQNRAAAIAASDAAPGEAPEAPRVRAVLAYIPGSLKWAIARYQSDRDYARLSPRTRAFYAYVFDILERWGGHLRLRQITREDLRRLHDELSELRGQRTANAALERLRYLFRVANLNGEIAANPAALVRLHKLVPSGLPWPRAADPAFVAAADALGWHSIGTMIQVNAWLGQREGDLIALPRALYRNGQILVSQAKTGAVAVLPLDVVPALVARLEAELAHQAARGVVAGPGARLFLRDDTGAPWDEHGFRKAFRQVREAVAAASPRFALDHVPKRLAAELRRHPDRPLEAATRELLFKDLRHTAILRLVEAGVALDDVRAITGHATPQTVLDHYLSASAAAGRRAFARRRAHEEGGT